LAFVDSVQGAEAIPSVSFCDWRPPVKKLLVFSFPPAVSSFFRVCHLILGKSARNYGPPHFNGSPLLFPSSSVFFCFFLFRDNCLSRNKSHRGLPPSLIFSSSQFFFSSSLKVPFFPSFFRFPVPCGTTRKHPSEKRKVTSEDEKGPHISTYTLPPFPYLQDPRISYLTLTFLQSCLPSPLPSPTFLHT